MAYGNISVKKLSPFYIVSGTNNIKYSYRGTSRVQVFTVVHRQQLLFAATILGNLINLIFYYCMHTDVYYICSRYLKNFNVVDQVLAFVFIVFVICSSVWKHTQKNTNYVLMVVFIGLRALKSVSFLSL